MVVMVDGRVKCFSELHPENAESPIEVTDEGIDNSSSRVHPKNADSPIDLMVDGIDTLSKLEQS